MAAWLVTMSVLTGRTILTDRFRAQSLGPNLRASGL
jgi:hypothetical protein